MNTNRKPISAIVAAALEEVTEGTFSRWPSLAVTALLDDFQDAWLRRLHINYNFEALEMARSLCCGHDAIVFKATGCSSVSDVRNKFSWYIAEYHPGDDRVIIALKFNGKQIDAEWVESSEYS